MLKSILGWQLLLQLSPDANTGGGSSDLPDDKGAESSTAGEDEKQVEPTEGDEPEEGETVEESSTETEGEEGETQETEGQEPPPTDEAKAEVVLDKPEDKKLDFNEHPRFQELIKEKNTFKAEVESLKPQAARAQALESFCQTNGITENLLQRMLEYGRLLNSDPEKAFALVEADYNQLAPLVGKILPQDLQEKVAAGVLDAEAAKEIARYRAQQQHQQWQGGRQAGTLATQNAQAVDSTIGLWAQSKQTIDPDLKPGTPVWKYLDAQIKLARQSNPNMTPQQVPGLVEGLYKEAKDMFRSLVPVQKKVVKRPLNGTSNTNSNSNAVIKNERDVVKAIMSGKRPHQLRYS